MRIFGVILAGGAGRRMGGADKALLRLGDDSLIAQVAARFSPQVEAVAISANGDARRFGLALPVLPDAVLPDSAHPNSARLGPLAGLLAALHWAGREGADYLASCAVDTPYFPCDLVARLYLALDAQAGATLALARAARVHATFGLWPVSIAPDLAEFLALGVNPKVQDFAQRHTVAFAQFHDESAFDNINTPQDLARLNGAYATAGQTA